jgi:serine/threonine-protein kinase RsbW
MPETASIQCFAARSESLPALMDFIALRSGALGLPRGTSLRLQLVAEELFTNTFRHGECKLQHPSVTVGIELAGDEIEFTYEDCEQAWNPLNTLNPEHLQLPLDQRPVGGLGITLIDGLAERLEYARVDERNRIRLWMRREPS